MSRFDDGQLTDRSDLRWRVTTPTGLRYACRVRVVGFRLEVRLTTEEEHLVCARVVTSFDAARDIARGWLRSIVATGGIDGVDPGSRVEITH
jgi:hypothetical protein